MHYFIDPGKIDPYSPSLKPGILRLRAEINEFGGGRR